MKKILKYQITDLSKGLIVYFVIMSILISTSYTAEYYIVVSSSDIDINLNGTGLSNFILALVLGICMYKEHYFMAAQNGISRKTFFKSNLCTIAILGLLCSIYDVLLTFITELLSKILNLSIHVSNIVQLIYFDYFENKENLIMLIINFIFNFVFVTASAAFGVLIASVFFRLHKKYRTIFLISIPILLCCLLPMSYIYFPDFWIQGAKLFLFLMGLGSGKANPFMGTLTLFITSIILFQFNYLMLRKTEVQL